MKKTMKTLLAMMAGVMTFSACSNEDVLNNEDLNTTSEAKPILSFTAATESDGTTRAAIDGLNVKWQTGDAIMMMDGTNTSKYNLATGAGTTTATFNVASGSTAVSGANIYALYPYSTGSFHSVTQEEAEAAAGNGSYMVKHWKEDYESYGESALNHFPDECNMYGISEDNQAIILAYIKGQTIGAPAPALSGSTITNLTIPNEQTVAAGQTVDPKTVLMVAKADAQNNLAFKNVCSYVKVTPTVACKKIEVRTEGAYLAGTFDVANANAPVASGISGGKSVVTLKAAEGDLAAGTYYIAVLPGVKSNGIEIRFHISNESFNYNTRSTSFELVRNNVYNGGDNSGASATYWTLKTNVYGTYGWPGAAGSPQGNIKTLTFSTGVAGPMPAGAIALNNENNIWSRNDGSGNFFIETTADRIFATDIDETFYYAENLISITGLDKIDVSEITDFGTCFGQLRSIPTLDLSTWKISPTANTSSMFFQCRKLSSLTLNNTFHGGYGMFDGTAAEIGGCTVYGVTDEAVKNNLRTSDPYWASGGKMHFYGE